MKRKFKRIIFFHQPHLKKGGMPIIDERNRFVLQKYAEILVDMASNPFVVFSSVNKYTAFFYKIALLFGFVRSKEVLIQDKYPVLEQKQLFFLSHSSFGFYARDLKRHCRKVKIFSFFHNVESDYNKQLLKKKFSFILLYRYLVFFKMEKELIENSDRVFVLNRRDSELLNQLYHYDRAILLPTTLLDRYNVNKALMKQKSNEPLKLLFVGSLFPANEEAVYWLAENISPYINAQINIVGLGMENLKDQLSVFPNVNIVGEVCNNQLDEYYYYSDIFISTVFSGGGMKTKIAEAMMFGLPIIGTKESFQGYDFDYSQIGIRSDNSEEMISFIKRAQEDSAILTFCSKNARNLYLERYSYVSSDNIMNDVLESFMQDV